MNKNLYIKSLAAVVLAAAQSSWAEESGPLYLGVDIGSTHFAGDHALDSSVFAAHQYFSGNDTSAGLHLGYQLVNWFALELGYMDFGSSTHRFALNPNVVFIVAPNDTQQIDASGLSLAGVFTHKLSNDFSVLGVLGASSVNYQSRWRGGFSEVSGHLDVKHDYTDQGLVYGVGAKYALSQALSVRVDLRRNDLRDINLDTASLSLEYAF